MVVPIYCPNFWSVTFDTPGHKCRELLQHCRIYTRQSYRLAQCIPGAELIVLPGVSHFAPLQRPEQFNRVLLAFLGKLHS